MMDNLYKESVRAFRSGDYDSIDAMMMRLRRDGSAELFARLLEGCCIDEDEGLLTGVDLVLRRFRQPTADYAALQLIGYAPDPSLLDPSIDRTRITELKVKDYSLNTRQQFRMKRFPDGILQMTGLTFLDLSDARIDRLPEGFGALVNLFQLNMCSNLLEELPLSFGKLRALRILDLGRNRLRSLPECFGELVDLSILKLNANELLTLPESVTRLRRLYILDISDNKLQELPESVRLLENLEVLDVSRNRGLRVIPAGLAALRGLRSLTLKGVAKPIPRPAHTELSGLPLQQYLNKLRRRFRLPEIAASSLAEHEDDVLDTRTDEKAQAIAGMPQALRNLLPYLTDDSFETERLGLQLLKGLDRQDLVGFLLALYEVKEGKPFFMLDNPYNIYLDDEKAMRLLNGILSTFDSLPKVPTFDPEEIREAAFGEEDARHLGVLSKLTGLTSLSISLPGIRADHHLQQCPKLHTLRIKHLYDQDDPDLSYHPELRNLSLSMVRSRKCLTIGGHARAEEIFLDRVRAKQIQISDMPALRSVSIETSSAVSLIIRGCPSLTEISLSNMEHLNRFVISALPALAKLNVRYTNATAIIDALGEVHSLEELELDRTNLTELPASLWQNKGLHRLSLPYNRISGLPMDIQALSELEALNLKGNRLVEFPIALLSMQGLQTLDLSSNHIRELPDTLTGLSGIKTLGIDDNLLQRVPESLLELPKLSYLNLGRQKRKRFSFRDLPSGLFGRNHPVKMGLDCDRLTRRILDAWFRADTQRMQRSAHIEKN